MMHFYMTPGFCSTGIPILVEEIGLIFEVYPVNLLAGDQHKADYLAINPKAKIPTLVPEDDAPLTEFQTIAWCLGRRYPRRRLLPEESAAEARVLEMMNYAVNTLHGQGFARIFSAEKFAVNADDQPAVRQQGQAIVDQGLAIVDTCLQGRDYVLNHFTIADAALFYVECWADRDQVP